MRIKTKILFGFLAVAFLLIFVELISINVSQSELERSIGSTSALLASDLIDKIDRDIYARIEYCEALTTRPLLRQSVMASNELFDKMTDREDFIKLKDKEWVGTQNIETNGFMEQIIKDPRSNDLREAIDFYEKKYGYKIFSEIFITNKYGVNVVQSSRTSDYLQADEEWWQKTKEEGKYISDVEFDESSGAYILAIGVSMKDENGNFIGTMKAALNINETFNIMREAENKSRYESTGFKLIDNKGKMIHDSEGNYKLFEDVSHEPYFAKLIGNSGYFENDRERNEERDLIAYARSQGYESFSGLGWTLLQEYKAEEIQGPIIKLKTVMAFISTAGMLAAILIGLLIFNSIIRPINELRKNVQDISSGKNGIEISVNSSDEIGEFAIAFRSMLDELEKSKSKIEKNSQDLEIQIKQRTKELEEKVGELEKFNQIAVSRELKMIELKKKINDSSLGNAKKG
jgi:HAMP domain-containing protein